MSKESTETAAAVADKIAHSVDYMEQYTADLVDAVRKGAGGVGELLLFCPEDILQRGLSRCVHSKLAYNTFIWKKLTLIFKFFW